MALTTGGFTTYSAVGNREDLQDIIYNIDPTDTPFVSMCGKPGKAKAVYHEWQTDTLADATTNNAQLEGGDVTPSTSSPTTRIGNYCQIFQKSWAITGTQEAVDHAGRESEKAYQKMKRGKELKRDIALTLLANQGQVAGDATTARKLRGLPSWLATNVDLQTGTTTGVNATAATAARTDGTQRALTETMLKSVVKKCFDAGATPTAVLVGSHNKQTISGFTGRTQARQNIASGTILGAASLYASDFGDLKIVPNRFQRERDAFVPDPEYVGIAALRPIASEDLAKIGDSDRGFLVTELTLVVKNEKAHGAVFDLTTS